MWVDEVDEGGVWWCWSCVCAGVVFGLVGVVLVWVGGGGEVAVGVHHQCCYRVRVCLVRGLGHQGVCWVLVLVVCLW